MSEVDGANNGSGPASGGTNSSPLQLNAATIEPVATGTQDEDQQDQQQERKEWFKQRFLSDDELNSLMREIGIDIDGLPVDDHGNAQRLFNLSDGKLLLLQSKHELTWAAYVEPDDPEQPAKWSTFLGRSYAGKSVVQVGNLLLKWAAELALAIEIKERELDVLLALIKKLGGDDRKRLEEKLKDVAYQLGRMVIALQMVSKAGNRLRNVAGVNAVRSMAANVPAFIVPASSFDRDPDHVVALNCVIDLRSGAEIPFDPKFRLTRSLTCSYVLGARAPRFEQFLGEVMPDDETALFVQELAGYWLTGHTWEQVSVFFKGVTNSGKSTLLNAIRVPLGEVSNEGYAVAAPMGLLRESSRSWHATAAMIGARLVVDSEFDRNDTLNVDSLKRITGERFLQADEKYGRAKEFLNSARIAGVTNYFPANAESRDAEIDEATLRRLLFVPMSTTVVRKDKHLGEKLAAESVGILAWMVEGARRWYERGRFVLPQSVLTAHAEFREQLGMSLHPIEQALRDAGYMWPDPTMFTSSADLTAAVNEQFARRGMVQVDIKAVTAWCDDESGLKKDRPRDQPGRKTGYWGIGIDQGGQGGQGGQGPGEAAQRTSREHGSAPREDLHENPGHAGHPGQQPSDQDFGVAQPPPANLTAARVPGLTIIPDAVPPRLQAQVTAQIEAALAADVAGQIVRMKARIQISFGEAYILKSRSLRPAPPLTGAVADLAALVAEMTGIQPSSVLANVYDGAKAGLSRHIDSPSYGPVIVGVSLGEAWPLVFSNQAGQRVEVAAPVGSVMLITGEARTSWAHAVPERKNTSDGRPRTRRLSLTFRTTATPEERVAIEAADTGWWKTTR